MKDNVCLLAIKIGILEMRLNDFQSRIYSTTIFREYIEKIYDIKSPWNSTDWTWIKFTEEDDIWCGEFRGKYRGVSCSTTLGIIVVLT